MNALNMIDELMNQQDDEFGFDFLGSNPLLMKKDSSYTIGPDGTRLTAVNEDEIRKIKERVEAEKQESLKQFQELLKESISDVKANPSLKESQAWENLDIQ